MILDMLEKYKEGYNVVLAVRADREESAGQKFFSNLYASVMQKIALSNMPKGGFDSFLIDRQVVDHLLAMGRKKHFSYGADFVEQAIKRRKFLIFAINGKSVNQSGPCRKK